jgi:hypothetical protein
LTPLVIRRGGVVCGADGCVQPMISVCILSRDYSFVLLNLLYVAAPLALNFVLAEANSMSGFQRAGKLSDLGSSERTSLMVELFRPANLTALEVLDLNFESTIQFHIHIYLQRACVCQLDLELAGQWRY